MLRDIHCRISMLVKAVIFKKTVVPIELCDKVVEFCNCWLKIKTLTKVCYKLFVLHINIISLYSIIKHAYFYRFNERLIELAKSKKPIWKQYIKLRSKKKCWKH